MKNEIDIKTVKALWVEVVFRAVIDVLSDSKCTVEASGGNYQKDAREWLGLDLINYTHSAERFGSFEWICEHFDLPASKIRNRCRKLIEEGKTTKIKRMRAVEAIFLGGKYESAYGNKKRKDNEIDSSSGFRSGEVEALEVDKEERAQKEDHGLYCDMFDSICA